MLMLCIFDVIAATEFMDLYFSHNGINIKTKILNIMSFIRYRESHKVLNTKLFNKCEALLVQNLFCVSRVYVV